MNAVGVRVVTALVAGAVLASLGSAPGLSAWEKAATIGALFLVWIAWLFTSLGGGRP